MRSSGGGRDRTSDRVGIQLLRICVALFVSRLIRSASHNKYSLGWQNAPEAKLSYILYRAHILYAGNVSSVGDTEKIH